VFQRLILPPGGLLLLALAGLVLAWGSRRRRLGLGLALASVVSLWLLATPLVSLSLMATLEPELAWDGDAAGLAAVVVLGGDVLGPSPDLGGVTVGALSLERTRAAARVQRGTGLPLLVTGGPIWPDTPPVAELMAGVLRNEFGVPVEWVEPRARDTRDNAAFAAEILRPLGITRIGVVTHAFHVPRARRLLRAQGLDVVPMPTAFHGPPAWELGALLPSSRALRDSALACHELAGLAWGALVGWD
jgi:uncharacterized SAM-binding protein YcdF (DUF218 family)